MSFMGDVGDALFGGGKTETSQATSGTTRYTLPGATKGQAFGENALLNILKNYMSGGGQGQLLAATGGPTLTSGQKGLLEGQTAQFMEGLQSTLDQWRKGAMSQAQQSGIARGIPLSDIARGQEANVDAQYLQQLAQGFTGAKTRELQGKLDYPMQNLQYLLAANQPYINMLNQLGMSRLTGPRNIDTTGTGSGTSQTGAPGFFPSMGIMADVFGKGAKAAGSIFGGGGGSP